MIKNQRNLSDPIRFITDHNLGKLAKWLRLLGYDTLCHEGKSNKALWSRALKDNRIVLTRKKNLQYYPKEVETLRIAAEGFEEQLAMLFAMLDLKPGEGDLFKYCSICNNTLEQVERKAIIHQVPSYILETHHHFYLCSVCAKVYWRGSHVAQMRKFLKQRNLTDHP